MLSFDVTAEQYKDKEYMAPIYKEIDDYIEAYNKGRVVLYDIEAIKIKRDAARDWRFYEKESAKLSKELDDLSIFAEFIIEDEYINDKYCNTALYEPDKGITVIWKPIMKTYANYPEWDEYGEEDPIGYTLFVH